MIIGKTAGGRSFRFWLPALLRKSALFFLYNTLFSFFLYILGSFQKFTDSTQLFLLELMNYTVILSALASFFAGAVYLITFRFRKKSVLFKIILSGVIFTFTLIFYIFINFLKSWF